MKIKLNPAPFACVGGYSLDLYCKYLSGEHGYNEFPHQFFGETFAGCVRQAKKQGWLFDREMTTTCPKCAKHKDRPR